MQMNHEESREINNLLFSFMSMFHEKFLHRFRRNNEIYSHLKKNHVKIIRILYRYNSLTSTEIAKRLDIEKGSVTTLIDQLAELGLVIRDAAPNDRRKSLILLTDSGRDKIERIINNDTQTLNEIFHDVQPHDLHKFLESLKYAAAFMNEL